MRDPLLPSERQITREITKAALHVTRLKGRIRTQRKRLEALDAELVTAQRALRDLVRDVEASATRTDSGSAE